jgi:dipeptidyl aminopeptidase/acylaminoacyl peptidase
LTNFGGPGTGSPAWSPDGRRVAFDSRVEGRPHIYVIPATGGRPERVTDVLADNYLPEWSKDGRWIYYCSTRSGIVEVWRQPVAGGAAQQLTHDGGWAPAESPDGSSLFYQRRVPAGWSLRQLNLATGLDREILPAMVERAFGIARDGVYYIPIQGADGRFTIQFRSFESEVSRPVATIAKPMARSLSLAPDGSFLLYSQLDRWGQNLVLVENFH